MMWKGVLVGLILLLASTGAAGAANETDTNGWTHATGHSPASCGRRIVRQILALRRSGYTPGYVFQLPSGCPRIALPHGYEGKADGRRVLIYETASGQAILAIEPPPPAPIVQERDGVIDGEIWEHGEFKGRVVEAAQK